MYSGHPGEQVLRSAVTSEDLPLMGASTPGGSLQGTQERADNLPCSGTPSMHRRHGRPGTVQPTSLTGSAPAGNVVVIDNESYSPESMTLRLHDSMTLRLYDSMTL